VALRLLLLLLLLVLGTRAHRAAPTLRRVRVAKRGQQGQTWKVCVVDLTPAQQLAMCAAWLERCCDGSSRLAAAALRTRRDSCAI
jgi:hypothetical protein